MVCLVLCDRGCVDNRVGMMEGKIEFRVADDFHAGAVIVVDKPLRWTSFDVVNKIRSSLRKRCGKIKVGHAGTLDPLATGVVVVCVGKETKAIERYMGEEKEYVAEVTFGHTTPSYDLETLFDGTFNYEHVNQDLLMRVIAQFTGEIEQCPPVFSAIRVDGVRAYEKARSGAAVRMQHRRVVIREIELLRVALPVVELRIVCGKGTYIRSLAHDLGRACGSGAYLSGLRRTQVGEFRVEEACQLDQLVAWIQQEL